MVEEFFASISLDGVKGILLDLDNTLYPYQVNHERAMSKCIASCKDQYNISEEDFHPVFKTARGIVHKDLHGQGASHSRLLYFQKFSELYFGRTDPGFSLQMENLYWTEFISGMEFYPGAEAFLLKARNKGIKVCIITDLTAQIQHQKWLKLQLGRFADYMVSSEEAGIEKPEAYIFELSLHKLGMNHEEVIMIGDNYEKDIKGAEAMGIRSYWLEH